MPTMVEMISHSLFQVVRFHINLLSHESSVYSQIVLTENSNLYSCSWAFFLLSYTDPGKKTNKPKPNQSKHFLQGQSWRPMQQSNRSRLRTTTSTHSGASHPPSPLTLLAFQSSFHQLYPNVLRPCFSQACVERWEFRDTNFWGVLLHVFKTKSRVLFLYRLMLPLSFL